jgi:hypothetical protein
MNLGPKDYLDIGNWNVIDDESGFKCKASDMVRRWDGYMVKRGGGGDEQRHPQDLIRIRPEKQSAPWVRPDQPNRFVVVAPVDPNQL